MSNSSKEKCRELLKSGNLTDGRKRLMKSVLRQIELNDELYPTVHQKQILDGLYRSHLRQKESQTEKDAREFLGL